MPASIQGLSRGDYSLPAAYVRAGLALISIPSGRKGPSLKGWQTQEGCIRDEEAASRMNGANIGLAHVYCKPVPTGAVDIDDLQRASLWLANHGVDLTALLAAADAVQIC